MIRLGIHVHAEPHELAATLAAVRAYTPPVELLLLPDGADAATRAALASIDLPQLGTHEPRGPPACFNRLTQSSDADVYVLLESGARPGPGWLRHLLDALADPRHGLAGPSTNLCWNEQGAFPAARANALVATAAEAQRRFTGVVKELTPLHSLADFCYAVRGDVVRAVGEADESYGLGPCWEMDYNVRAARAGFLGVWAAAAYVWRAPFTRRRAFHEAHRFEASRRRYQDKFCGKRLRGESFAYESHCKGDACADFAPPGLIALRHVPPPVVTAGSTPSVSCIMPTRDRRRFVPNAVRWFLRQDLPDAELVVLDDGDDPVRDCVPDHPRLRYQRCQPGPPLGAKRNQACALARGEIIAHWDDDDWYAPDRLRRQLQAIRDGADLCGSTEQYFWQPSTRRAFRYRYGGGKPALVGTSLMYRKSLWERARFPEIQIGEDVRFVQQARGPRCDLADPSLFVGLIHDRNTSPKLPDAVYWQPVAPEDLQALLGDDFALFSSDGAPLVSCIMPTADRRAFVTLALRLFAQQQWPNRELIVVDDGRDAVGDLCAVPNVRYLRLDRRATIGAKRNLACAEAHGEIVAHWDDDDWYGPDRLTVQAAPIVSGAADLTGLENRFMLELPAGAFWTTGEALHRRMFVGDVHGGTLVFRKSLFDEGLRYPDRSLAEDAELLSQALRRGKRLCRLLNDGVFVYVRHGTNSWRFDVGRFLDPSGWRPVAAPPALAAAVVDAFRAAANGP